MRASIIIASHNEGDLLANTIESCIETASRLDYEIIVADDASTDGSAESVARRFPMVRLHRHTKRQGASPTKHLGSRQARGEVLLFLDGHSKPEYGSLPRLVRGVEETEGQAIITPRILALDAASWKNIATQTGHGYAFDLRTIESRWVPLQDLNKSSLGRGQLFESPALIGCAIAVSRQVYDKVWGFDQKMQFWGVEDLDFSLKCWLMGHPILHDPEAAVGHRFQKSFDRYSVPMEHIVVNELRLAYKNFTHAVWAAWLPDGRMRHSGLLPGNPEGLWARAWELFKSQQDSARQERSYLQARRQQDEFWYASRFGLSWPLLMSSDRIGAQSASPSPSPKPSGGPSPSPAPCTFTITGPADVPGLTRYTYKIALAAGQTPSAISWTVDRPTASFVGATNTATVTVAFKNTSADWIKLRANFTLNGKQQCAEKQIALVRVQLATPVLGNPGKVATVADNRPYLVTPPASGAPAWVTTHTPGSVCGAFTFNGGSQASEAGQRINSSGGGVQAFTASAKVTLTSPAQKPTAQQRIQVGFVQSGFDSGNVNYATTPPGKKRVITIPTTNSVDWLSSPCSPAATDEWPWYDQTSRITGTGSGSVSPTIVMSDSPAFRFPSQFNPNDGADPNKNAALTTATDAFAFTARIGVRTLDADLGANTHYFSEGQTTWVATFVWPVTPAVSIVTLGPANWTVPAAPSEISVNVVPTVTNHQVNFLRWIPT